MTAPKNKTATAPDAQERVLRVNDGYRGRPSNEQLIPEGLYLESDPRLQGIPQLLIKKGHAEWVQGISAAEYKRLKAQAENPDGGEVPDGFRGVPAPEGQTVHGLLTPEEISAMNRPGYEPPEPRDGFQGGTTSQDAPPEPTVDPENQERERQE